MDIRQSHESTADGRPWYRQLWPWLLAVPPLAAVVGGLITVVLAVSNADPELCGRQQRDAVSNRVLVEECERRS